MTKKPFVFILFAWLVPAILDAILTVAIQAPSEQLTKYLFTPLFGAIYLLPILVTVVCLIYNITKSESFSQFNPSSIKIFLNNMIGVILATAIMLICETCISTDDDIMFTWILLSLMLMEFLGVIAVIFLLAYLAMFIKSKRKPL